MDSTATSAPDLSQGLPLQVAPGRMPYLDALKVMSSFLVIVLHAVGAWAIKVSWTMEWFTAAVLSGTTRCAVPCFIMVSGALMLSRDTGGLPLFYRKVLVRYGLPLAAALIYYKIDYIRNTGSSEWLKGVLYDFRLNPGYHLWYMWMWLGLLAATPVFRKICSDRSVMGVFLVLGLFFSVAGTNLARFDINIPIFNTVAIEYGVYYVLGYWLNTSAPRLRPRTLGWAAAASLAMIIAATFVTSLPAGKLNEYYLDLRSLPVLAYSTAVFLLFREVVDRAHPFFTNASRSTFGIYLLHILVLGYLLPAIGPQANLGGLIRTVALVCPLTFCIAWSISAAAKLVPGLRHLIP